MTKKNLHYISFGTGHNQVPLIKAAIKEGYEVIGVDQNIESEGMSLCGIKIEESILNFRKIYQKILMAPLNLEISGGFSASFGKALLSWSYIVERLNLYGVTRPLIEVLLDKLALRDSLKKSKMKNILFRQPKFTGVNSRIVLENLEKKLGFPMIIKPRDGHSKKNIFMIENKKHLKKVLNKKFLNDQKIDPRNMIFESFIPGNEITVVGFVQNFRFHLIFLADKFTTPYPPFVEVEHSFPSVFHDLKEEIEIIHQSIVDSLQIPCAPIVSEWKYSVGKLYLMELSPQIPGEYMGDFLIPKSLNYPYFSNLVKLTTGQDIQLPDWDKTNPDKVVKVKYWVAKPNPEIWEKWSSRSQMNFVLNDTPRFPPQDNSDRYGVMGFVL